MPPANSITEKTRLPLSLVILIVVASCSGVGLFAAIRSDVSSLRSEVQRISAENITREEFKDWQRDLERSNQFLAVPGLPPKQTANARLNVPVIGKQRP